MKEFSYFIDNQSIANYCNKKEVGLYPTSKLVIDDNKYNCCLNENKKELVLPICR